jgi:hypothetical protein
MFAMRLMRTTLHILPVDLLLSLPYSAVKRLGKPSTI